MKEMPKKELIEIINAISGDIISKQTMEQVFDTYGDDYYRDSSCAAFELCNENKARKELFNR